MAKQAFLTFREAGGWVGNSDGAFTNLPIWKEPVEAGQGCQQAPGTGAEGAAQPSAGGWSLARQHMVTAEGVPGAKDSQGAGSLQQSGGLAGHAALGAGFGIRTEAEFLEEGLHSETTKEGSVQRCGDTQDSCSLHSPPPTLEGSGVDPAKMGLHPSGILQSQWPAGDLPDLVDLLPSREHRELPGGQGRTAATHTCSPLRDFNVLVATVLEPSTGHGFRRILTSTALT